MELVCELGHYSSWAPTLHHSAGFKEVWKGSGSLFNDLPLSLGYKGHKKRSQSLIAGYLTPVPRLPTLPPGLSFRNEQILGGEENPQPCITTELNGFLRKSSDKQQQREEEPSEELMLVHGLICTKKHYSAHLILYQRQKLWQWRHTLSSQTIIPCQMNAR